MKKISKYAPQKKAIIYIFTIKKKQKQHLTLGQVILSDQFS